MTKSKQLIIYGIGETAEIAYEYFSYDSEYEVLAFSADREFIQKSELFGLPIVPFDEIEDHFDKNSIELFVAASYVQLNRVREKMFNKAKAKGFKLASYISSKAFVWRNVQLGENVFIFENNVIQHHCKIGDNVILWSGNHIGHRTVIEDHVYLSSHCVISGFCKIGKHSFLGVNCTFNDQVSIAEDTIVGSGSLIVKNFEDKGALLIGAPAKISNKTAYEVFNIQ